MKRFIYIILITQYFLQIKPCMCQVIEEWRVNYIGPIGIDALMAMCIDINGNVYVTGNSRNTINSADYATVKYSTAGVQQWFARYGGLPNRGATAYSIAVDRFGNSYVTGYAPLAVVGGRYTIIKYNQAGVQVWVRIYYGAVSSASNVPYSIKTDYEANVYVTGGSYFDTTGYDYTTIKYDSSGVEQWVARYRNSGQDWANRVIVDNSGNVYVTGYSQGDTTYNDIATVKYNSSGVQQWDARYNGTGNRGDSATDLKVDNYGNVYVCGASYGGDGTGYDYVTIKYNTLGVQQWAERYNGNNNWRDIAHSLAVDDSGNVYVTGESYVSGRINFATIKYSPSGIQQWATYYIYQSGADYGYCIAVDNRGGIYVTGSSWGGVFGTRGDFATIKYSPAGIQQWVIRTNGSVDEVPSALAVDTIGNVYVAGSDGHYLTIKYNQLTGINLISNGVPGEYHLYQNYPNPFNPVTEIRFDVPAKSNVELRVYDVLGRLVNTIYSGMMEAGKYKSDFRAENVASGVYYYELSVKSESKGVFREVKKMVVLK